jgi:hypothetical protein
VARRQESSIVEWPQPIRGGEHGGVEAAGAALGVGGVEQALAEGADAVAQAGLRMVERDGLDARLSDDDFVAGLQ